MIDPTKQYWLYIYSHVYVVQKTNKILLYNVQNAIYIETENSQFQALIKEVHEKNNLGVVILKSVYRNDIYCNDLIKEAIEKQIVGLIEIEKDKNKPIVLLPILNLQRDVDKLVGDNAVLIGDKILSYLTEINLVINNKCDLECPHCNSYYKQTKFCTKNAKQSVLMPNIIESVLQQALHASIIKINISGGDINYYRYWNELKPILDKYNYEYHFFIHYRNFSEVLLPNLINQKFEILVNFPIDKEMLLKQIRNSYSNYTTYHFLIEDEIQYELIDKLIEEYQISNFKITPFFTGSNYEFFKSNIFLDKEDILSEPIIYRKIFCNQKLNSNYFGKLNIFPDGDTKANVNKESIGYIQEKPLLEIIYDELIQNTAWRQIRNSKPCNNCLYQFLCPPVSNYEIVMNKFNCCNI